MYAAIKEHFLTKSFDSDCKTQGGIQGGGNSHLILQEKYSLLHLHIHTRTDVYFLMSFIPISQAHWPRSPVKSSTPGACPGGSCLHTGCCLGKEVPGFTMCPFAQTQCKVNCKSQPVLSTASRKELSLLPSTPIKEGTHHVDSSLSSLCLCDLRQDAP